MKATMRIALVTLTVICLSLVAMPRQASAHPMGNFTINQYSALTIGSDRVDVFYVVDMAEIPAFQELGTIRAGAIRSDGSVSLTAQEHDSYAAKKGAELAKGLSLSLGGQPLQLSVIKRALSFPPGAGNLPTLRLEISLSAPLSGAASGSLAYSDSNYEERIGWKEVIANGAQGTALQNSSVPTTDRSNALHSYNPDLLKTPPSVTTASISFAPGAAASSGAAPALGQTQPAGNSDVMAWAESRRDALTDLISQKELPVGAFLVALLVALGFGAGHALSPGHGKTLVAAYLVGSKGTPRHALLLGLTVTVSHTIGVFALGIVLLMAANISGTVLYQWLPFLSGLGVAFMGITLFVQRQRVWRRAHATASADLVHSHAGHAHSHDSHTHDHDHDHEHTHSHDLGHDHDHQHTDDHTHDNDHDASVPHKHGLFGRTHTHLPGDSEKVTMGNLLTLGIAGGIIPCPSALVVLFAAVAFHKIALGLTLIVAFSVGLAAVLTGIGLLVVYGRGMVTRINFNRGFVGVLPMISALLLTGGGLLLAYNALTSSFVIR